MSAIPQPPARHWWHAEKTGSQRPSEAARGPRRELARAAGVILAGLAAGHVTPAMAQRDLLAAADEYAAALIEQCARPSWPKRGEGQ